MIIVFFLWVDQMKLASWLKLFSEFDQGNLASCFLASTHYPLPSTHFYKSHRKGFFVMCDIYHRYRIWRNDVKRLMLQPIKYAYIWCFFYEKWKQNNERHIPFEQSTQYTCTYILVYSLVINCLRLILYCSAPNHS